MRKAKASTTGISGMLISSMFLNGWTIGLNEKYDHYLQVSRNGSLPDRLYCSGSFLTPAFIS